METVFLEYIQTLENIGSFNSIRRILFDTYGNWPAVVANLRKVRKK